MTLGPTHDTSVRRAPRTAAALALVAGLVAGLAPGTRTARAEATPPRYAGTIVTRDDDRLTLRSREGTPVTLRLARTTNLLTATEGQVRDIKPESYISVVAAPQGNGLKAEAVSVYSPSQRGLLAGHRPWDLGAGRTLTGGWVRDLEGGDPRKLVLGFEGGERTLTVPADTRTTQVTTGEKALLAEGAEVVAQAHRAPDGTLEADIVVVGRGGVVPTL
ncbi:hypothetical protein [Methylobacterium nigriterrae]|uniref:hypothetical protein n=1 Tax=Methylobacterium nigriterrae TaxID=3127512 RepID=UPI0030133EFA